MKERETPQMNKVRNERGEVTADTTEIQRIVRKYYKQLYMNKLDNLKEMNTFLATCSLPKLNQKESENWNRLITTNDIEAVIKKLPANKIPALMTSQVNFTKQS